MSKEYKINFMDKEHKDFYKDKMEILKQYKKADAYYRSLIYTLGICSTTRNNFEKIFNMQKGEININSINNAFQTETSKKVTRLAFSMWNNCMYDSEEDIENGKMSKEYNIGEIFSCSYAPYFFESIKIRYPEYTKDIKKNCEKIDNSYINNETANVDNLLTKNNNLIKDIYDEKAKEIERERFGKPI